MRVSLLFTKTVKDENKEDLSRNAQLLTKAGYINQLMAGVYSFLPLGLRVLNNVENIIREEMNKIGGQEVLMPALQPREIWDTTGRWDKIDVLFKLKGKGDRDLALGPTHEEVVTPLVTSFIHSYRDVPKAVYQIQTKFRNEPRAKSGLLRGREFRMKDMYSFHDKQSCLDSFYDQVINSYQSIYKRCGIGDITLLTYASGGIFSKYSHEFQTITPYGEDTVYRVPNTNIAINKEIIDDKEALREIITDYKDGDENQLEELRAIEVGNIFKLGSRFTNAFEASLTAEDGNLKDIVMGCYGIGPSRIIGTIVECLSDDKGLIWPEEIAPFKIHLVSLLHQPEDIGKADAVYQAFLDKGIEVLYDDRSDVRPGEKLADADLMGMPYRVIISKATLAQNALEIKKRGDAEPVILSLEDIVSKLAL